ncbi:Clp protease N-terminal domain-containing protein [Nocardiopsis dassonvillei]|uniref:Clp protease N-terminal domain-containing protein n=1 Tax=Nocardiopsis dassonvillei TaxID=2014 RepID=UPI003672DBC8
MFELFTERARYVMGVAIEESKLLKHKRVTPEHLLLGLLYEGEGIAARALGSLRIDHDMVLNEVVRTVGEGRWSFRRKPPLNPDARAALENALEASTQRQHSYIGTEHLLLGLLRDDRNSAARTLRSLGVLPEAVTQQVHRALDDRENHTGEKAHGQAD